MKRIPNLAPEANAAGMQCDHAVSTDTDNGHPRKTT